MADHGLIQDGKIKLLRDLERQGIIRESCPEPYYWRFEVLKPDGLPAVLEAEFNRLGEIRW